MRVDTFAHSECTIPPYYDSMIAKIIVHGRDRQEAIARMRRTLEMTVIEGIKTSIPLHLKILADPDFVAGRLSTAFMERFLVEKKASRRRRPPGRSRRSSGLPVLYAIIDVDVCAARAARSGRRSPRPACAAARALLQLRAKTSAVAARSSTLAERVVGARARTRGARSSSTIAPTSRGWPARRRSRRPGRPRRRRRARDRRRRTRSSACPRTTREQIDAALASDGDLRRGRSDLRDAHQRHRLPRRAVSSSSRYAAGRGKPVVAIGGITLERAADVIAAGASAVAVITDLLAAAIPSAHRARSSRRCAHPSGIALAAISADGRRPQGSINAAIF